MEDKFDTMLSEDHDDDGELDVEHYPIPKGLERAWDALNDNEALEKALNATIATAYAHAGDKSPGPGLGVNHVIKVPKKSKRKQMKDADDPTGAKKELKKPKERATNVIKTTKETYTGYRGIDAKHDYEMQDVPKGEISSEEVEDNRDEVQRQFEARKTEGNKVDIRRGWKSN